MPPVASDGTGAFTGEGEEGGTEIRFNLTVSVPGITQAHIHLGGPDENGGVVAFDRREAPDELRGEGVELHLVVGRGAVPTEHEPEGRPQHPRQPTGDEERDAIRPHHPSGSEVGHRADPGLNAA